MDNKLKDYMNSFYQPTFCGECGSSSNFKIACFGWIVDSQSYLVAVSLQGNYSAINAMYESLSTGGRVTLYMKDGVQQVAYSRSTYGYEKIPPKGSVIPGTELVSVVIVNKALFSFQKDTSFIYIPDTNDEDDIAFRMVLILKEMTTYPIMEQWAKPLMRAAVKEKMMVHLKNKAGEGYYASSLFGFAAWQMTNEPAKWEKLIQRCLQSKSITIELEKVEEKHEMDGLLKLEKVAEVSIQPEDLYTNIDAPDMARGTDGTLIASPEKISSMFPLYFEYEPEEGDGKVSREYWFKHKDGFFVAVWDWKCTNLYDDVYPSPEQFWAGQNEDEFTVSVSSYEDEEISPVERREMAQDFILWIRDKLYGSF